MAAGGERRRSLRAGAMRFVVLLGVVSLFADMTYEGARGIAGPYLAILGAGSVAVGLVAGAGELLGYTLRIVSGRLADLTGRFWALTLGGYALNLLAVPLLALAPSWQVAAVLLVAERVGRAVRNPPRDVMLAHASTDIGRGWGFGVHEALDQLGALLGPLLAAGVLALRHDYREAFAVLLVPAALALAFLGAARLRYRAPEVLPAGPADLRAAGMPRAFWIYCVAACLVAAGFADFALIAFHLHERAIVGEAWVPVLYAVAMGTGGLGSLLFGRWFDRAGIRVLVPLTLVSASFAPLVFLGGAAAAVLGVAVWGLGMGVHESIMAAAVAGMVPSERLASAYGLFTGTYGTAWFLGSVVLGLLYAASRPAVVAFAVAAELAAVPLFASLGRPRPAAPRPSRDAA
jgi:MFS family permease